MVTRTPRSKWPKVQKVVVNSHIRIVWGAEPDNVDWTGWAVWDDYAEECPVFREKAVALRDAKALAASYAGKP